MDNRFFKSKIINTFLFGDTTLLRLWFAGLNIFMALYIGLDVSIQFNGFRIFSYVPDEWVAFTFLFCGAAILYSISTNKYNYFLLFIENILALCVWGFILGLELHSSNNVRLLIVGSSTALYLLTRYPDLRINKKVL